MSQDDDSAAIQLTVQRYLYLFSQKNWADWIELWADDGVLEFPFAPHGRKGRYVGKTEILDYMKAVADRMEGKIQTEGMDYFTARPLADPGAMCLEMAIKGRVLATGAPYQQKYISIVEMRDGKVTLYREYWNPLVSMDVNGGREAWTAAFGSPADDASAA